MKDHINYSKIKRNSIKKLILPFIFIIVFIVLYNIISFNKLFFPTVINTTKNIEMLNAENTKYVEYSFDQLYYSNYDYISDNEVIGYFYYTIVDSQCTFVLISSKHIDSPEPILMYYSSKAKLTPSEPIQKQLFEYLAKDLNWTIDGLTRSSTSVIINELEYHEFYYFILFVAMLVLLIVSIYLFIINILYYFKPYLHPEFTKLKRLNQKPRGKNI